MFFFCFFCTYQLISNINKKDKIFSCLFSYVREDTKKDTYYIGDSVENIKLRPATKVSRS